MNSDVYALIDTALKIGLGALIAAAAGYIKIRAIAANDKEKEFREVRKQIIINSTEKMEPYFSSTENYLSKLDSLARQGFPAGQTNLAELKPFKKMDHAFCMLRNDRAAAISSLHLIGVHSIDQISKRLIAVENKMRLPIVFESTLPSHEEVTSLIEENTKIVHDFYEVLNQELADVYQ